MIMTIIMIIMMIEGEWQVDADSNYNEDDEYVDEDEFVDDNNLVDAGIPLWERTNCQQGTLHGGHRRPENETIAIIIAIAIAIMAITIITIAIAVAFTIIATIVTTYEQVARATHPFLTTWLTVLGSHRPCKPTLSNSLPANHMNATIRWRNMNSKNHKYTNIVGEFSYMQIDCALAGVGKGRWSHNKKMNFLKITKLTSRQSKEWISLKCFVFAFDYKSRSI